MEGIPYISTDDAILKEPVTFKLKTEWIPLSLNVF